MTDAAPHARAVGWRRMGPVLCSGALHVALGLGLALFSAYQVVAPRLLIADLVELPTERPAPERPQRPPEVPRQRPSVAREAARADPAVSTPAPPPSVAPEAEAAPAGAASEPAATTRTPSPEPRSPAGTPAADPARPAVGPGEDGAPPSPPRLGHRVTPGYPEDMRRAAIEGTAVVVVAIQADGSVGEVRLRQSAGHAELDAAAVEAVKRWRFAPAQRRGVAVQFCCVEIPIAFRLH